MQIDNEKSIVRAQDIVVCSKDEVSSNLSGVLSSNHKLQPEDELIFNKAILMCAKKNKEDVSSLLLAFKKNIDENQNLVEKIEVPDKPSITIDLSDSLSSDTAYSINDSLEKNQLSVERGDSLQDNAGFHHVKRRVAFLDIVPENDVLPGSGFAVAASSREYKKPFAVRKPFVVRDNQLKNSLQSTLAVRVSSSSENRDKSTDAMVKLGASLMHVLMQNLELSDKKNAEQEETLNQSISKQKAYGTTLITTILGIISTLLVNYLNTHKC